eukprot:TRINITY_DN12353_c0_g1_i5.p1 TRINITY_DN12353_c0_g1~~TRINITY_DN12353_c0_g1_i5.p1  ORF type:complete len:539 (-),score=98.78 TRINITY_DN12353_c0_g1_i5:50-1666(-)
MEGSLSRMNVGGRVGVGVGGAREEKREELSARRRQSGRGGGVVSQGGSGPRNTANRDRTEVDEWIDEYRRIKKKLLLISRESDETRSRPSDLQEDLVPVLDMDREFAVSREKEEKKMWGEINIMKRNVRQLRQMIMAPSATPEYLVTLKQLMDSIEADMLQFKQRMREKYEILAENEKSIIEELPLLLERFESWDQEESTPARAPAIPASVPAVTEAVQNNDEEREPDEDEVLTNALAKVQNLIENEGGATGGWDPRDHDMFLKAKAHFTNRQQFLDRCVSTIPQQTLQSVLDHESWYYRYQHYVQQKKTIISEWRQNKEKAKKEAIQREFEEAQRLEAEENAKRQKQFEEDRKKKLAAVQEWKEIKKQETQQQEQAQKEKEEAEKRRQKQILAEQRMRAKEVLEARKQRHEAKAQELMLENSQKSQPKLTADQIRRVQEKNEELAKKRAQQKQLLEEKKKEREERLNQLAEKAKPNITVDRDPNRLTEDTDAMKARRLQIEMERQAMLKGVDAAGKVVQPSVIGLRVRALPDWRRGV